MLIMLLIAALIVGMSLGLLGAGGSILTVPALMLLLDMDEKSAIASSLAIVGLIALTGMLAALRHKTLQPKVLALFVLTSLPAASLGAYLGTQFAAGAQTLLLAIIMLIAAGKMFFPSSLAPASQSQLAKLLIAGTLTGLVTGLVGVGGGFLIVPALVLYAGLTMQQAVANSLVLIALNAATAFTTLLLSPHVPAIDWTVISVMAGVGSLAVIVGQQIANKLDQSILRRIFAGLLVVVAMGVIVNLFWS